VICDDCGLESTTTPCEACEAHVHRIKGLQFTMSKTKCKECKEDLRLEIEQVERQRRLDILSNLSQQMGLYDQNG